MKNQNRRKKEKRKRRKEEKTKFKTGTAEMAQLLGALVALAGDPDYVPSTHVVVHNLLEP